MNASVELPQSAAPLYEKVKQFIQDKIDQGEWTAYHRLPGEPELARELGISRMTINRALRELANEHVLERIPGVGTFVAAAKPISAVVQIHNIADEIIARGETYACKVLAMEKVIPPRPVWEGMELRPNKRLYHSLIVHFANGVPAQLEDRYVLPDFAPDYLRQDFSRITTTGYLYNIAPPTDAEHVIEAAMADEETRRQLDIEKGEPCLVVTRRTWVGSVITTYMRMTHPGSRYSLLGRASSTSRE